MENGFLLCPILITNEVWRAISIMNEKFGEVNDLSFLAQVALKQKEFLIKVYFPFAASTTVSYLIILFNCQIKNKKMSEYIFKRS